MEDDAIIARSIKKHLENWEYEVQCTKDFSAVTKEFAEFAPQLVLMDIGLPFYNGYYWCSEIRKISKVPIIFLSSAADNMNIVMAVNMGADDFIAKPFDLSVLTVKVQAMLRRTYDFTETGEMLTYAGARHQDEPFRYRFGDCILRFRLPIGIFESLPMDRDCVGTVPDGYFDLAMLPYGFSDS